jgi:hypothetical protein
MVILIVAVVVIIAVVLYASLGKKGTVKPVPAPPVNNMSGFQQPHANLGNPGKSPVNVTAPVKYVKGSPKQNKKAAKKYNGRSF